MELSTVVLMSQKCQENCEENKRRFFFYILFVNFVRIGKCSWMMMLMRMILAVHKECLTYALMHQCHCVTTDLCNNILNRLARANDQTQNIIEPANITESTTGEDTVIAVSVTQPVSHMHFTHAECSRRCRRRQFV